jgi:hypothetical protein
MVEEFSGFKNEAGLTLPHIDKIKLMVDSKGATFLADWELTLTSITFKERNEPNSFYDRRKLKIWTLRSPESGGFNDRSKRGRAFF